MSDTFLITGGGTGGHIYPGVAVASKIKEIKPEAKIVFVGARRGIESRIFPKISYPFHLLFVGPLNRVAKLRIVLSLIQLPFAILYSGFLLLRYRPNAVIGFGGYASSPLLIASFLLKQRFYQWEGNAHPGMVTRKVITRAKKTYLAFPSKSPVYKTMPTELVGVPTRMEPKILADKSKRTGKNRVFVFGGSQGARAINESLWSFLKVNTKLLETTLFFHQTGRGNLSAVPSTLINHPSYSAEEFVHDMEEKYDWADFVICRAGASTISEITQMGLPAILIPLPTAADDHQKKNALWMSEAGAGILLEQKNLNEGAWGDAFEKLSDRNEIYNMAEKSKSLAQSQAALKIAKELCSD